MKALVLGLPGHFIRNVARALTWFYDLNAFFSLELGNHLSIANLAMESWN